MIFVRLPQRENHVSLKKAATIGAIASLNKALTGGNYGPTVLAGSAILGANIKKTIAVISLAESLACGFAIIGYFFGGIYVDAFLIVAMSAGTVLAAIPSVCSSSVPSAANQLSVPPKLPGRRLKIRSSSSTSRPRGLKVWFHE